MTIIYLADTADVFTDCDLTISKSTSKHHNKALKVGKSFIPTKSTCLRY